MIAYGIDPVDIRAALARASLEWLLCERYAFSLTTATPLQRAICRIAEGRPLGQLARHRAVVEALGGEAAVERLPSTPPRELVVIGAVRSAKSLLAAAAAVRWSQSCDVSGTRPSETPRVSIASLDKDKARVVLQDHLQGTIVRSEFLRLLLAEEPRADALTLLHPTGRPIEVKVVAGRRAGGAVVSRWSAGAIFDEAPRMLGQDDAVINLDETRRALKGRLRPGAQLLYVGSPDAPFGPVYELAVEHMGAPSADVVVLRARGPDMNPLYWTHERCEHLRRTDPDAYRTDVLADFLTPDEALLSNVVLERATRRDPVDLPPRPELSYAAAMDPATRGNAWTLTIGTRQGRMRRVVLVRQWVGSSAQPLSPRAVARDIAHYCRPYGVASIETDRYYVDALTDIFREQGLQVAHTPLTDQDQTEAYLAIRTKFVEGEIEVPADPQLLSDLRRIRRRATQRGVQIVLPRTGDGRHCDYAPALMLLLRRWLHDEKPQPSEHELAEQREREAHKRTLAASDPETTRLREALNKRLRQRRSAML